MIPNPLPIPEIATSTMSTPQDEVNTTAPWTGEVNVRETSQKCNSDNGLFQTARGSWVRLATAKSMFRMLGIATELGINTPEIHSFL